MAVRIHTSLKSIKTDPYNRVKELERSSAPIAKTRRSSPVLLDCLNAFPDLVFVCEQRNGQSEYIPLPDILKKFRDDYTPGESLVELWLERLIGGL